jgi:hypothetical protein
MYLIFFGKAQSFIFYAYDENGLVTNFNKIIPDLDLLESQLLNVDKEDNKEMVSKYVFVKGSPDPYSLIKIYAPAQPSQGFRIEGCTYGVAFLAKQNLKVSKQNIQALNSLQKAFAAVALSGIKFLKPDFIEEATNIYNNFVKQIGFSKIEKSSQFNNPKYNSTIAVYVNNLLNFDNDISQLSNKIYFTEDLERLIRAQKKWGDNTLKIMEQEGDQFFEYKPKQVAPTANMASQNQTSQNQTPLNASTIKTNENKDDKEILRIRVQDAENQIALSAQKLKNIAKANQKLAFILKVVVAVFILGVLTSAYFIYQHIKNDQNKKATAVEQPISEPNETEVNTQNVSINTTLDLMQKWDKKKELVDFVSLVIKLEDKKYKMKKDSLKNEIIQKGLKNQMDTTLISIFLKNI